MGPDGTYRFWWFSKIAVAWRTGCITKGKATDELVDWALAIIYTQRDSEGPVLRESLII